MLYWVVGFDHSALSAGAELIKLALSLINLVHSLIAAVDMILSSFSLGGARNAA
jgi:hypothetical protein